MAVDLLSLATPHRLKFVGGDAIVFLPNAGSTHRLTGPAAGVVHRILSGDVDPCEWTSIDQDAAAALCELGVLEIGPAGTSSARPTRRAVITGAAGLGIASLMLPAAAAAVSGAGGSGGGGGGGYLMAWTSDAGPETHTPGLNALRWTSSIGEELAFDVMESPVTISYVVVGGGGGGARRVGGGGGGGQVLSGSETFAVGAYKVFVGAGGNAGSDQYPNYGPGTGGGQSRIELASNGAINWSAGGGGGGNSGSAMSNIGATGGSSGTFSGGIGKRSGGGGGAGANQNGADAIEGFDGGAGGAGLSFSDYLSGTLSVGGGGGGGGYYNGGSASHGGGGGGSYYGDPSPATDGRGGGGGGGGFPISNVPTAGSSGIVAIKTVAGITTAG